ncbi:MAG: HAD family hydrolase, partial [Anaerolineales bacterium]
IALDADDTLWHNEWLYQRMRDEFIQLYSSEFDPQFVEQKINQDEIGNLKYYGYGIKSFILSLIEAAVELSDGCVDAEKIQHIIEFGKEMLRADVPLFEQAEGVLIELSQDYDLMLVTKGESFEQMRKVRQSGLAGYFRYIEVVGEKSKETYLELLGKYRFEPSRFLMIGNSLRSDVIPVLEIGGQAVLIPYDQTWFHENEGDQKNTTADYYEIEHLGQLPDLIRRIESP